LWRGDRISENLILGKYRVLKKIGKGGSCIVYLAEHDVLGQRRVLKCISKDNPYCKTFLKEVTFLKNYKHNSIPVLYDFDEDENNYYIIQEYIEGNSLKNQILFQRKSSLSNILESFIQLASFFEYLHGIKPYPILYLDLKPEHVIFTNTGIKVIDFGAIVELKGPRISGKCMGTYGFAAPELIAGEMVDERADIYSIGALLFWCLTGDVAAGNSPEKICYKLMDYPDKIHKLINCCLEDNPKNRYKTMKDLCDELTLTANSSREEKTSYRIAVIGSQSRVGVTHFCVELVNYLNENNKCLYEEKNDNAFLEKLCNNSKSFYEEQGIIYGKNFEALPKYGKAVLMDNLSYDVIVQDYGCLFESVISDIRKTDLCIAIGGANAWEIEFTKQLFECMAELSDKVKILYVLPRAVKFLQKKETLIFPYNPNPFKLDKKTRKFFEKLSSFIFVKRGRGDFLYEKFKKNNKCTYDNWSNGE